MTIDQEPEVVDIDGLAEIAAEQGAAGEHVDVDDEVVDAEIVEEPAPGQPGAGVGATPPLPAVPDEDAQPLIVADEWSDIDDGDVSPGDLLSIPLYQLNRKVDGGFINEDTGETIREIDAVLMKKVNTRAWWPEDFGKGDKAPSCRSDDGTTASDRSPAQQPGWVLPAKADGELPAKVCAECPNSKWDGDEPPPCTESIEFLAFVPTSLGAGRVVRLRFAGLAFGPARTYWDSFRTRLPKRPPIAFITHVALEEKETPNGTFLVPHFTRKAELTLAGARPILEARENNQAAWQRAIATEERPALVEGDGSTDVPHADEEPF